MAFSAWHSARKKEFEKKFNKFACWLFFKAFSKIPLHLGGKQGLRSSSLPIVVAQWDRSLANGIWAQMVAARSSRFGHRFVAAIRRELKRSYPSFLLLEDMRLMAPP